MAHHHAKNVDVTRIKASGVPDAKVIELQGNARYAKCLACEKRFELEPLKTAFFRTRHHLLCDQCGGIVKTATISFGQSHARERNGESACRQPRVRLIPCHWFIIITVSPGRWLPCAGQETRLCSSSSLINHQDAPALTRLLTSSEQEGIGGECYRSPRV